jgi:predicted RecA/RadA family phage recombinase
MAKNITFGGTNRTTAVVTSPANPVSGDAVVIGQIPGVATNNKDADGETVVALGDGQTRADLSVTGIDGVGNSAVAIGDIIYFVAGDTPALSKKATGVRFGYARQALTSGSTGTISVQIGY